MPHNLVIGLEPQKQAKAMPARVPIGMLEVAQLENNKGTQQNWFHPLSNKSREAT